MQNVHNKIGIVNIPVFNLILFTFIFVLPFVSRIRFE